MIFSVSLNSSRKMQLMIKDFLMAHPVGRGLITQTSMDKMTLDVGPTDRRTCESRPGSGEVGIALCVRVLCVCGGAQVASRQYMRLRKRIVHTVPVGAGRCRRLLAAAAAAVPLPTPSSAHWNGATLVTSASAKSTRHTVHAAAHAASPYSPLNFSTLAYTDAPLGANNAVCGLHGCA